MKSFFFSSRHICWYIFISFKNEIIFLFWRALFPSTFLRFRGRSYCCLPFLYFGNLIKMCSAAIYLSHSSHCFGPSLARRCWYVCLRIQFAVWLLKLVPVCFSRYSLLYIFLYSPQMIVLNHLLSLMVFNRIFIAFCTVVLVIDISSFYQRQIQCFWHLEC